MSDKVYDVEDTIEKVILIGVKTYDSDDTESCLLELGELIKTAGAQVVGTVIQNREAVHPGTYIGKGKIEEVKDLAIELNATGVVCDDELSPAQLKNLEAELDMKVMDRTLVILDIFAGRAQTNEGKIQVELAQLKYRLSRLAGLGSSLSRLGGGIGTRGPGEKKIEMDRRLIRDRISQLGKELDDVKRHREVARAKRSTESTPVVAIVGYTNAGKSTLLNHLTDADVLSEDKLFATLDPTTRMLELESKQQVLLTDTVGFIRKLPHHLVDAFRSTLEEAKYSDIIIHVVDSSNPDMSIQMATVYRTLEDLGVEGKPIITLFNKIDKYEELENKPKLFDEKADKTLKISAKQEIGFEDIKNTLEELLRETKVYVEHTFGFNDAGKIQQIRKYGQLLKEEYTAEGIYVEAYVPKDVYGRLGLE